MAFTQHYFTSDSHFGHQLMLNFRPFVSTEEMDEFLIEAWNAVVRPGDIVWHLGDFSCHDEARTKQIFQRLQGRKRLILGNHDLDHSGCVRKTLRDLAWDQPPTHYAEAKQDGERVILHHYAMRTWAASIHGSWHLYGHSHGRLPAYGRSRDCSLIAVVKLVGAGIAGQAHGSLRGRPLTASSWRWTGSVDQCGVHGYLDEPALAFLGSVLTAPSS